jgi:hypothetical protein
METVTTENKTQDTPTSTAIVRKIGSNRKKGRVWIEGKTLTQHGWTKGTPYVRKQHYKGWLLTKHTHGSRNVAGGDDRPVIDINGKYVDEVLSGCTHVNVRINNVQILIAGK